MSSARRSWPAVLSIVGVSVGAWASARPPAPANSAIVPEERGGAWRRQHEAFVEAARRGGIDLLFLGDSITALWDRTAPAVWSRYYVPRRAANFGIGGDRTQHLLWRLDHGEVDGISPKVVVLLIGTNNLVENSEDEVVEGVGAVVGRLRARLSGSKILLLGLFPRGAVRDPGQASTDPDPRVARLNARLARLDDGRTVKFLDLGPALLDGSGKIRQAIEPDFAHLSRKGYQTWADAMEPTLWRMMDGR